jgi:hypothetical protein
MVADDMEGWLSGLRQRISVRYTGNRIGGSNPSSLRHSRCQSVSFYGPPSENGRTL